MERHRVFLVSMMAVPAILYPAPAKGVEPCGAWMASLGDYDAAFEKVMQGEPEDLLRLVREARDPGLKDQARKRADEKLRGLRNLTPPPELSTINNHLVNYAMAVVAAVGAAKPTDTGTNGVGVRRCYEILLDYYRAMRDLMVKHACRNGDVDALEQNIIPQLEKLLEQGAPAGVAP